MFTKPSNPFTRDNSMGAARDALSPNRPGTPASATTATSPAAGSTTSTAGTPSPAAATAERKPERDAKTPLAASDGGSRLIVGPDVKLKSAEILDCDTLVVEGRVEATMDSRVIRIAEEGLYTGKVSIDIAEIHGHFEGELTARSQLMIHATGRVSGKIRYGKLLIEEGGQISGEIRSLDEEDKSIVRPRPEILASVKTAAG